MGDVLICMGVFELRVAVIYVSVQAYLILYLSDTNRKVQRSLTTCTQSFRTLQLLTQNNPIIRSTVDEQIMHGCFIDNQWVTIRRFRPGLSFQIPIQKYYYYYYY